MVDHAKDKSSNSSHNEKGSIVDESSEHSVHIDPDTVPWWKLDIQIIPVVTMMYLLNFLDRGNIGNARVAGLQKTLGMSDVQYSMALTATLIPYNLVEIPSNLFLTRIGAHIVLPTLMVLWGLVTTLQGLIKSYNGLIAARVFLGLCEGGLLPGVSLYVASFYPRSKLQFRVALFFASTALAGAFSGLLAAAITHLDGRGGRPGWAYIFIIEGGFTIGFGLLCFIIMPRSLATMRFLTVDEKEKMQMILVQEHTVLKEKEADIHFSWSSVLQVMYSPHAFFYFMMGLLGGETLTSLAYFLPSIVQSLGYRANRAQLMSVPPYAAAWVLNLFSAVISDRLRVRGATLIFHSILATVGFAIFLGSHNHRVQYGSLFLFVPGVYCTPPALLSWVANNSAPRFRRATLIAFLLTSTGIGGIFATWLFGALSKGPNYRNATIVSIAFSAGVGLCAFLNIIWLSSQNKKRKRAAASGGAVVDDRSPGFVYAL